VANNSRYYRIARLLLERGADPRLLYFDEFGVVDALGALLGSGEKLEFTEEVQLLIGSMLQRGVNINLKQYELKISHAEFAIRSDNMFLLSLLVRSLGKEISLDFLVGLMQMAFFHKSIKCFDVMSKSLYGSNLLTKQIQGVYYQLYAKEQTSSVFVYEGVEDSDLKLVQKDLPEVKSLYTCRIFSHKEKRSYHPFNGRPADEATWDFLVGKVFLTLGVNVFLMHCAERVYSKSVAIYNMETGEERDHDIKTYCERKLSAS
jgi:hypothetical protein